MSELGKATPEQLEAFQSAVRENPELIGQVVSKAIEEGILVIPDASSGVPVDTLLAEQE